jgi:hypothetical protein
MTPGSARGGAVRVMLALVALCVMSPGWLQSANAGNRFSIMGRADGLMPGIRGDLVLSINNPFDFAIVVHGIEVDADDASNRCGAENLTSPGLTKDVRVKANTVLKVTVPIKLRSMAPTACEDATFLLAFDGTATRP